MLSQPGRQILPFPPFFFFPSCFFHAWGWILSHLLHLIFLRFLFSLKNWITSCLFQLTFLLPLTPYQSGIKTYQCITSSPFLGPFQIFLFLLLKSVICSLHFTSSVIFQHFIFTICPEPQALWHFWLLCPYLKVTLEKGFEKHHISSSWFIFALNSMRKETCQWNKVYFYFPFLWKFCAHSPTMLSFLLCLESQRNYFCLNLCIFLLAYRPGEIWQELLLFSKISFFLSCHMCFLSSSVLPWNSGCVFPR